MRLQMIKYDTTHNKLSAHFLLVMILFLFVSELYPINAESGTDSFDIRLDRLSRHYDPLFNLPFDPNNRHFPKIFYKDFPLICRRPLANESPTSKTYYLFGYTNLDSLQIYIINDTIYKKNTIQTGLAVVIENGKCYTTNPFMLFNDRGIYKYDENAGRYGKVLDIKYQELNSLFLGSLKLYEEVFHGKVHFLTWLDTLTSCQYATWEECGPTWHSLPTGIKKLLEDYRKR